MPIELETGERLTFSLAVCRVRSCPRFSAVAGAEKVLPGRCALKVLGAPRCCARATGLRKGSYRLLSHRSAITRVRSFGSTVG